MTTPVLRTASSFRRPEARADGSNQTSNGLFVFTGSVPAVSVGDQVDVSGTVVEFFNWTELTDPTVTMDTSGNALPAAVLFTQVSPGVFVPSHDQPWPANELERFEGMLVRVENGRVSSPTDQFGDTHDRRGQHARLPRAWHGYSGPGWL